MPDRTAPNARTLSESMPPPYGQRFGADEIDEHVRIVHGRGASSAHAEIWASFPDERLGVCVVADDAPGLLALISAALILYEFDVVAAEAYCRVNEEGRLEAVDFFWVRRVVPRDPGHNRADVARFSETLAALVGGILDPESILDLASAKGPLSVGSSAAVRFEQDADGALSVIVVEADDRAGLLLAITSALYRQRVQVLRSEVRTIGGRVLDRFDIAEVDGDPIRGSRRNDIQIALLSAIESLGISR